MKATELRNQTITELQASLSAARRDQFKLRLQKAGGEMTITHPFKQARRKVARIMTLIREKEHFSKQEGKQ